MSETNENFKLKKFNVPLGIITQGKTCLEKLKTLLKIIDSTTSILIRSSKRWSLAAAISVGIDEKDDTISDEDTLSGKNGVGVGVVVGVEMEWEWKWSGSGD